MSDKLIVEIIAPEKSILKSDANEVTIPSYEGQMGILKDHIPLITFLRPGFISIKKSQDEKKYYVEDGIVEFSENNLLILTSTAKDLNKLDKKSIDDLLKVAENKLQEKGLTDKDKYIISYKINSLKQIN